MGSAKILGTLVGHRIVTMTRYSWWPPKEAVVKCIVASHDVFLLTSGPLAITFDTGQVIGLASDPSLNSVVVWIEQDETGRALQPEPMSADKELYPVVADDPKYADSIWHSTVGRRVARVAILVRRAGSAQMAELPNEVGLCFVLDSGIKVIAAHGLHDDSDDFVVIREEMISSDIRADLKEVVAE